VTDSDLPSLAPLPYESDISPAAPALPASTRSGLGEFVWEILQTLILAGLLIIFFRAFIFQNYLVEGNSMLPTLEPQERLIVGRIHYLIGQPQRGDVIVFQFPQDPERDFVKRVIGLPGETVTIEQGQVFIDGRPLPAETYVVHADSRSAGPVTLAAGEYWVMGDNRAGSSDSRSWGPLQKRLIIGKAWFVYLPLSRIGLVSHPDLEPGA